MHRRIGTRPPARQIETRRRRSTELQNLAMLRRFGLMRRARALATKRRIIAALQGLRRDGNIRVPSETSSPFDAERRRDHNGIGLVANVLVLPV